jgi:type IV secretory pathway ATPase VirB11/archaellum biosynthesis ATPase
MDITLPKAIPGQIISILNQCISDIHVSPQPMELIKEFPSDPQIGEMCIKQDKGVHVFVSKDDGWKLLSGNEEAEESLFDTLITCLESTSVTQLSELYNRMDEFKLKVERKLLEKC